MSTTGTSRAGSCEMHPDKVGYPTPARAHDAVRRMEETGFVARAFKCKECGQWHAEYATATENKS